MSGLYFITAKAVKYYLLIIKSTRPTEMMKKKKVVYIFFAYCDGGNCQYTTRIKKKKTFITNIVIYSLKFVRTLFRFLDRV